MAAQGTQDEKNISQTLVDYFVGEKAIMLKEQYLLLKKE